MWPIGNTRVPLVKNFRIMRAQTAGFRRKRRAAGKSAEKMPEGPARDAQNR